MGKSKVVKWILVRNFKYLKLVYLEYKLFYDNWCKIKKNKINKLEFGSYICWDIV